MIDVKVWSNPYIAGLFFAILFILCLAHAEYKECFFILEFLEIEHSDWLVPLRVGIQLGLEKLLLLDDILVIVHLLDDCVTLGTLALGKLYQKQRQVRLIHELSCEAIYLHRCKALGIHLACTALQVGPQDRKLPRSSDPPILA